MGKIEAGIGTALMCRFSYCSHVKDLAGIIVHPAKKYERCAVSVCLDCFKNVCCADQLRAIFRMHFNDRFGRIKPVQFYLGVKRILIRWEGLCVTYDLKTGICGLIE